MKKHIISDYIEGLQGREMRSKGQSQNTLVRIITSPFRVLVKARDFYIRSITNCGNSMNYSNPMDAAGRFEALPRSYSVVTSKSEDREDFAELMRAASAKTLIERMDMELVLKQQEGSKVLPKSISVGMGRIDEDNPCDFGDMPLPVVPELYPRSRSYAVTKRTVAVF